MFQDRTSECPSCCLSGLDTRTRWSDSFRKVCRFLPPHETLMVTAPGRSKRRQRDTGTSVQLLFQFKRIYACNVLPIYIGDRALYRFVCSDAHIALNSEFSSVCLSVVCMHFSLRPFKEEPVSVASIVVGQRTVVRVVWPLLDAWLIVIGGASSWTHYANHCGELKYRSYRSFLMRYLNEYK